MPEAMIIQRYKYDKEKRLEYYRNRENPYDLVDDETGTMTASWWEKFNSLDRQQRARAEQIIAENNFSAFENADDEQIEEVLAYYRIKRDDK